MNTLKKQLYTPTHPVHAVYAFHPFISSLNLLWCRFRVRQNRVLIIRSAVFLFEPFVVVAHIAKKFLGFASNQTHRGKIYIIL